MIPFDFLYANPDSKEEAVQLFKEYSAKGIEPVYYAGGSEIITMCRSESIKPGAVIDIKGIAEAHAMQIQGNELVLGGCVTLRELTDSKLFPLLGTVAGRIADHTNQNRITLGGNLCGTISYRETSLPLLLSDAIVTIFGPFGVRSVSIHGVFDRRMLLKRGEMVLQVRVNKWFLQLPYTHVKKTANERIDYPLVDVSAINDNGKVRFAFSGLLDYPFRSRSMEDRLNRTYVDRERRVESALAAMPQKPMTDYQGSSKYRLFVLKNTLLNILEEWQ